MTYAVLKDLFQKHEESNPKEPLTAFITFSSFGVKNTQSYPWQSRTYSISSDNKAFQPAKCGYSLYGRCLDRTDYSVRLDWYMQEEHGGPDGWVIEDCCIVGYMLSDTEHGGLLLPQMFSTRNAARKAIMVMPDTYDRESDKWTVLPIRIYDSCHIDFETEPDLSKNNG